MRQIQLERLPVVAIIERDENAQFRSTEEQSATLRVLRDVLHINAGRQAIRDPLPSLAAIAGTIDVRLVVFETVAVYRGKGFIDVEVRRDEHHDLAPRRELGRRDVGPSFAVVVRLMNEAIVSSDPN